MSEENEKKVLTALEIRADGSEVPTKMIFKAGGGSKALILPISYFSAGECIKSEDTLAIEFIFGGHAVVVEFNMPTLKGDYDIGPGAIMEYIRDDRLRTITDDEEQGVRVKLFRIIQGEDGPEKKAITGLLP